MNTALAIAPARNYSLEAQGSFTSDLFSRFIDYTDRKDSTIKGYLTCIRQFMKWLNENQISQPQREDIKAYRTYLANSGLATGTQQQYLRAVKHFFKWTAAEGFYPNVADNIHGARTKTDIHRRDAFQTEDVAKISATIDRSTENGKRLYIMYHLVFVDGLRTIEIHRANVEDVKTIGGKTFLYIQGKGHDEKDTAKYLTPEVKEALDDYLASRSDKYTPKSPLFASTSNRSKGGRIATTTISTMFKECFVAAGFDSNRLTAHSGRHTTATTGLNEAGADIYVVKELMGHSDVATTGIYVHTTKQLENEVKYRQAIYDCYYSGAKLTPILPELEAAIKRLSVDQQRALLETITKGA